MTATPAPGWPAGDAEVHVPCPPAVPAGWYLDPWDQRQQRWWDGAAWAASTQASPSRSMATRMRMPARVIGPGSVVVFAVTGAITALFLLVELGPLAFLAAAVSAFVLVPLYAYAGLALDRLHPEPRAALAWTFVAGATAVVLFAIVLNTTAELFLATALGADPAALLTATVVAPVVEESGKAVALVLLYRRFRHEISGPLDGVVYATMVGLGFSTIENVLYYGISVADGTLPEVLVVRGVLSPFAHPLFTACTGIGLGLLAAGRTRLGKGAPALGLLLAIGLHALWNGSTELSAGAILLVFFGFMVPLFFGLVVLCRKEARREQRVIRQQLAPEVRAGLLTEADVMVFSDVRARRQLLKAARRVHPQAGAAAHELAADLLELANVRDRIEKGVFSERYGAPEAAVFALTSRVATSRWALPPAPQAAPWTGVSGALGVAVPRSCWPTTAAAGQP